MVLGTIWGILRFEKLMRINTKKKVENLLFRFPNEFRGYENDHYKW